jgi:hypothetical protein
VRCWVIGVLGIWRGEGLGKGLGQGRSVYSGALRMARAKSMAPDHTTNDIMQKKQKF